MSKMDILIANEVTSAVLVTPIPAPTDRIAAARFVSDLFGISTHNHRATFPGRPFSFPLCESVRFLSCRKGTPSRDRFDREAEAFILAERLKEERRKAGLTQEQLAAKIGTKKSYISRIENGKTDVQLSTLFKIFQGLGKRVSITIL